MGRWMMAGMLLVLAVTAGAMETMAYRFAAEPDFSGAYDPFLDAHRPPPGDGVSLGTFRRSTALTLPAGLERMEEAGRVDGLGVLRAGVKAEVMLHFDEQ